MVAPVFLLASERSGTNLVRRRLTECQPDVFGPAPLHLLKHLYYAQPYYGSLSDDSNFRVFIDDSLKLAYRHFSPWDETITVQEVIDAFDKGWGGGRSAVRVMHVLYTLYAFKKDFSSYFCKDNNIFDFVDAIRLEIPSAKFVYLYRDPRDVVVSQRQRPRQNTSVAHLASMWASEQMKCIAHTVNLQSCERVMCLSYEEFVLDEAYSLERLCAFLGVTRSDVRRRDVFLGETVEIPEWRNLVEDTLRDNHGKYKTVLSAYQLKVIEAMCWAPMNWLGYETKNKSRPRLSKWLVLLDRAWGKMKRALIRIWSESKLTEGQKARMAHVRAISVRYK